MTPPSVPLPCNHSYEYNTIVCAKLAFYRERLVFLTITLSLHETLGNHPLYFCLLNIADNLTETFYKFPINGRNRRHYLVRRKLS